jgi:hypothetical protein
MTPARHAAFLKLRRDPRLKEVHTAKGCRQLSRVSRETHPAGRTAFYPRFRIENNGSRSQSEALTAPPRTDAGAAIGREALDAARVASGACIKSVARPSARKVLAVMVKDSKKYAPTGGWGFQFWVGGDPKSRS